MLYNFYQIISLVRQKEQFFYILFNFQRILIICRCSIANENKFQSWVFRSERHNVLTFLIYLIELIDYYHLIFFTFFYFFLVLHRIKVKI